MKKTLTLKHRLAFCLALAAILAAFLTPGGAAHAAGLSVQAAVRIQSSLVGPQVNWNSGATN